MVLSLLDVPDDEIANDYALTELSEPAYIAWVRSSDPEEAAKTQPPFYTQTPADAMRLTMAELRERHGTPRDYLLGSGLTEQAIARLRKGLLE
jgi:hypothetical protein